MRLGQRQGCAKTSGRRSRPVSSDDLTSDDLLVEFQKLTPHHFRYGNSSPRHSRPVLDDVRML